MKESTRDTVCFMFHDVKIHPRRWNLTPEAFENTLRVIRSFREKVIITVDDGGVGNFHYIHPLLEKYELNAIFFIPTAYISGKNNSRQNYMNSDQIKEISASGHIIGSHSHSHPRNIALLGREKVIDEWKRSKLILEDITGSSVTSCSIPGGFYSSNQLGILGELGYEKVFNSTPQYGLKNIDGLQIAGRFSIENTTKISVIKLLLNRDPLVQSYLYTRHIISKHIHTALHRLRN